MADYDTSVKLLIEADDEASKKLELLEDRLNKLASDTKAIGYKIKRDAEGNIDAIVGQFQKIEDGLKRTFEVSSVEKVGIKEKISPATQKEIKEAGLDIATDTSTKDVVSIWERIKTAIDKATASLKVFNKETKGSGGIMSGLNDKISKVWNSIKRIVFYRLIRGLVKTIVNSIKAGIQELAKASEQANAILSDYMNAFHQLRNALATAILPILEAIKPLVLTLVNLFIDFANAIAVAFAQFKGEETFTKAIKLSDDYAESLKKTNKQLADFDKFSVLNKSNHTDNPFESAEVSANTSTLSNAFKGVLDILGEIQKAFDNIGLSMTNVLEIGAGIAAVIIGLNHPIALIVASVAALAFGIADVVQNGLNLNNLIPILTALAALTITISIAIGWLPALIVAIVGLVAITVAEVIKYWDLLKVYFQNLWADIVNGLASALDWVVNGLLWLGEKIVNFFISIYNSFVERVSSLWTWTGLPEAQKINEVSFGSGTFSVGRLDKVPYPTAVADTSLIRAGDVGESSIATSTFSGMGINNDQMTQSIYQAISQALKDNKDGTVIELDGVQVGRAVKQEFIRNGTLKVGGM